MTSKPLTIDDFVAVALKSKWMILSFVLVATAIAAGLCMVLPKSYRSSTTILVESQKIPESYVKGVLSGTVQDRFAGIRQMIISREVLKQVAQEAGLVSPDTEGKADEIDAVVGKMSKRLTVEVSKEDTSIKISFTAPTPGAARDVTAKLARFVVDENLKRREQLVEGATEFLHQELKLSKVGLEEKERAISEFKRQHMGELPEQMEANLRALDRLQLEMSTTSESINSLNSRFDGAEKAIREYQAGDVITSMPLANGQPRRVDTRLEKLRDLEQKLAMLSAEYKDNYPDIIHLREELKKLRMAPTLPEEAPDNDTANAGVQGAKKIVDPYMMELLRQRNEIKNELALQKQKQTRIISQIADYEKRVERIPAKEQQLMILVRDYENLQKNYQSLLDKRLSASISENLERRQKGEQFRIIDPANLPRAPESPNVILIMLAGLAAGTGLGYGTAFWLEHGRGLVRTPDDAESMAGFPILATIPDFATAYTGGFPRALPALPDRDYLSGGKSRALRLGESGSNGSSVARTPKGGVLSAEDRGRPTLGSVKKEEKIGDLRLELNLVAKWRPYSLAAEQYRVAATKVVMSSSDLKSTVIVVTSSVKGEGKSSSVSNLGYVLAEDLGKRTLLIDCDFKRPSLHMYCGLSQSPGLIDVLSGECQTSDALVRVGDGGPWILPSGRKDRGIVDLSQITKLKGIIAEMRDRFEYIILDAPPVLPLADMNLLSRLADFVVFVVRADITHKSAVETAVRTLKAVERAGVLVTGYSAKNVPKYLQDYYFSVRAGVGE